LGRAINSPSEMVSDALIKLLGPWTPARNTTRLWWWIETQCDEE